MEFLKSHEPVLVLPCVFLRDSSFGVTVVMVGHAHRISGLWALKGLD